ncbi:colicin-like bacteriocin tRNase domain-containing protein [Yersinia kristensenii]|uniref:colicin-like bacteriocin tRNase domain-containing protein n=2 Tax=Yersinia kristensenii TaxID=28152 RepID=UPI0022FDFE4B|nr:colicin-like bacteriocin tRNase domain-containing protein [Yersinia kristensenii]MDA5491587.1 S-type pyocin domain-containing protein [Yersinia kristensenii]
MGEGHSNVSGHGSRGPTGGVKGGPTGFGGGNPNSGKGWGVSQTPYGPLHNYNPSKFGHGNRRGGNRGGHAGHRGNTPNLSQRPELQVAIVPGVAVPLSLVASEWGLTLFKPKIVAGALDLALTRLAMFAVDAAPYVGRFAGVVGMLLAPSEIAKDDMSVIRRTVVTLPAERITSVPFAQLPTQPAVVADARLHDVVQDGVQKIAVVKSKHVPIMVPVVQAKPTARPGIFTAQILNGMPPIHIHVEKSSQPPATVQATGVSEVRDSPVTPVFSPLGNNSHDAIVYFPAEADTDPVYISVTTVLTPEQIKQGEEEDRQKQAQWEASYPVEAAQYQLSQAKDALVREQHNVEPYQAALEKLKNTWEGQLLSDPDEYPFSYEFDDYVYMWGNYGYHFMFDIEIKNREDLDNLLNIGGEAFDPFPDGLSQEDLEKYGDYAGYIMQELKIEQYDLLREHLLVHQDEINAAQLVLNSFKYQLDIAIDAVSNAEQHLTQVRAKLAEAENARLAAVAAERQRVENARLAAVAAERQRVEDARLAAEAAERKRVENARLAAVAADDLARQQKAPGQDTYSLPAHPLISRYSSSFAVAGRGSVTLKPEVIHALTSILAAALAKLRTYATSWWNSPLAMMVGASFNPLGTGHDLGAVPLAGSIALSEMGLSPTTPLPPQGEIDLPIRMLMANSPNRTDFYAVKTGAANISTKVKVGAAQFDRSKGVYTFTTDSLPPRTFTFTPVRPSGVDIGWVFPQPASAPATPPHTGVTIKYAAPPTILSFSQLDERYFHDYIIWFPADSGLQPVYVYLNSPRDEPGEVTGRGQRVAGIWLAEAGKGLGVPIPAQIADKLRGKEFSSFDRFREAFWQEVGNDPELSKQFKSGNLGNIKNGKAPSPRESEQVGGRVKYELHHVKPISKGGAIYGIDNLRVLTPKRHIEIHKEVK